MKYISLALSAILIASCSSVSIPASGSTSDGAKWSGYFTLKQFQIAGSDTVCIGKPPMGFAKVQTATFECDDGRTGSIVTTRQGMRGGIADVTFSDGLTGQFTYGS
ncbi:hypothetical protein [Planktomarina temperata]|jgi:hypothetical protein|uniref:hypothetical protein n=1 Tax=Planktomarina temperata TaxID=1284658 RepID=UPI0035C7D82E